MAELVLEYLKVILNWPVMGAVVILFFLIRHQKAIDKMLPHIKKAGPVEWDTQLDADLEVKTPPGQTTPNFEFLFLNQNLVPHTKQALYSLALTGPKSENEFKNSIVFFTNVQNRELEINAIIAALFWFKLIQKTGDSLHVTPMGKNFLRFCGFVLSN